VPNHIIGLEKNLKAAARGGGVGGVICSEAPFAVLKASQRC